MSGIKKVSAHIPASRQLARELLADWLTDALALLDDISSPLSPPAPSGVEEADARPPADPPRPVAGNSDDG